MSCCNRLYLWISAALLSLHELADGNCIVVGQGVLEARRGRVHGAVPLFFRLEMEQNKLTSTSTLTLLHQIKEIEEICRKIHIVDG